MERMKAAHALLSYYEKLYAEKYGQRPSLNRYRDKYAMADVVDTVGYERGRELIEYYFRTTRPSHPFQFFMYNFDRMDKLMQDLEKEKERRKVVLENTAKRVKEWESREFGSKTNISPVQE